MWLFCQKKSVVLVLSKYSDASCPHTCDGAGLFIQRAGLVAQPFSGAIDPDVCHLTFPSLWKAEVVATQGFVQLGADGYRLHSQLPWRDELC